jgi:hypothetical protein
VKSRRRVIGDAVEFPACLRLRPPVGAILLRAMPDILTTLLQHGLATSARSTVLRPLGWLVGLIGLVTLGCFQVRAPLWLGETFGISTLVVALLYLIAYCYFAWTDKDALRTERFTIQKMAIQKGFIGDDITGYIRVSRRPETIDLPATSEDSGGKGEQQK